MFEQRAVEINYSMYIVLFMVEIKASVVCKLEGAFVAVAIEFNLVILLICETEMR